MNGDSGEDIGIDWRNLPKSPSVVGMRLILGGQEEHIPGGIDFAERLSAKIATWINENSDAGKTPLIIRDSDRLTVEMLGDSERDETLDRIQFESAFAAQALGYSIYDLTTGNGRVEIDRTNLYHDSTSFLTNPDVPAGHVVPSMGIDAWMRTANRRPTGKRAQRRAGKEWNR